VEDPEKLRDDIGRRIAELRQREGLTQADVAESIGTTVPNYQRIEYGTQNLTIETMTKIANAIGCKVAEFFAPMKGRRPRTPKKS
jgi:transcriptional regulator with XRE-family HTH domain